MNKARFELTCFCVEKVVKLHTHIEFYGKGNLSMARESVKTAFSYEVLLCFFQDQVQ